MPDDVRYGEPVPARPTWIVVAAAGLLCVALSVASAAAVLPFESIWLDESAQMSGLEGSPMQIARWLAGGQKYNLWLPDDRMPPLSYWAGWAWSKAFGLSERPMRWFSVVCAALATGLVFLAGVRTWGVRSGLAAGLLLALSPNVIDQAVEIRAYGLFLLEAAAAFFCLTALLTDRAECAARWLAGLTLCGVAAVYTHFFGLVLSGGCLLAALVLLPRRGVRADLFVWAIAVTGIAAMGLWPFVSSSFQQTRAPAEASHKLYSIAQWLYHLYSHATLSLSMLAEGAAALGFVVAGGAALYHAIRRPFSSGSAAAGLLLALGSGALVTLAALFVVKSLLATKISYSVWMLPGIALLLGSSLARAHGRALQVPMLGIVLLLAAYTYALDQRVAHGVWFTHAPVRQLTRKIEELGAPRVAVVYEGDRDAMLFFPVYYAFGDKVRQYVLQRSASGVLELDPYPPVGTAIPLRRLSPRAFVVVRSAEQRSADLVRQLRHGIETFSAGPATRELGKSERWKLVEETSYRAFVGIDLHVFARVDPGS